MFDTSNHGFQVYPYEENIETLCTEVHRTAFANPFLVHVLEHMQWQSAVFLNNGIHTLEVKPKDLGCCQGFHGSDLVLQKNHFEDKGCSAGVANSDE